MKGLLFCVVLMAVLAYHEASGIEAKCYGLVEKDGKCVRRCARDFCHPIRHYCRRGTCVCTFPQDTGTSTCNRVVDKYGCWTGECID